MDKDADDDDADDVVVDDDDEHARRWTATTRVDDDDAMDATDAAGARCGLDDDAGVGVERAVGGRRRGRRGRERVIHGVDAEKEEDAGGGGARDGGARSRRGEHYE